MNGFERHSSFDLRVPPENEAREPAEVRGVARDRVKMLVSDRFSGRILHSRFDALASFLQPGDVVVVNDSATLPAAIRAAREDGSVVNVHVAGEALDDLWVIEVREGTRRGEAFAFPGAVAARILEPVDSRSERLWLARITPRVGRDLYLHEHGTPIRYAYVDEGIPLAYYQTIFARPNAPGSAEMPSAGRPFTAATLDALRTRGVEVHSITLHTGVSSPEAHEPPQDERFAVSAMTADAANRARANGRRVIAIGTTVVRALESSVRDRIVVAASGLTGRIVSREEPPQIVDGLLTGFHEPRASHLTMLETFLVRNALHRAYDAALGNGYLWHEFGDVHLIL